MVELMAKCFRLSDETLAVIRQIQEYKWLESEKAGHDIGMKRAASEWISRYYDQWFCAHYKSFIG